MRWALALAALLAAFPAVAQEKAPPSDDIVVEGLLLPGEKLPTTVVPATSGSLTNRKDFEGAQRLAKCAINLPHDRLSAVIDGNIFSPPHRQAQKWIVVRLSTCHLSTEVREASMRRDADSSQPGVSPQASLQDAMRAQGSSTYFDQSVTGVSIYDRGAILEQVLLRFVPDLALTPQETGDPAVQARFDRAEIPRNRFRLRPDYQYFQAAVCMVRLQPGLSVRLVRAKPASGQQRMLQSAILNRARICVGNAKRVHVDSTQFRIYIMDAVYRWVAASRGVPSLIPPDKA